MRATLALLPALAAFASAACRPRTSTTVGTSSILSGTDYPQSTSSSSDSSIATSVSTTSVDQTPTSVTTTAAATSTVPAAQQVMGFCIKGASSAVETYGQFIYASTPADDLVIASPGEAPMDSIVAYFNLDLQTGALTLNNTDYSGYQVVAMDTSSVDLTALRFATGSPSNGIACSNSNGVYTSGSILQCSVTLAGPGLFNGFTAAQVSGTQAWDIRGASGQASEDLLDDNRYDYSVGMYFDSDCAFAK